MRIHGHIRNCSNLMKMDCRRQLRDVRRMHFLQPGSSGEIHCTAGMFTRIRGIRGGFQELKRVTSCMICSALTIFEALMNIMRFRMEMQPQNSVSGKKVRALSCLRLWRIKWANFRFLLRIWDFWLIRSANFWRIPVSLGWKCYSLRLIPERTAIICRIIMTEIRSFIPERMIMQQHIVFLMSWKKRIRMWHFAIWTAAGLPRRKNWHGIWLRWRWEVFRIFALFLHRIICVCQIRQE